MTMTAIKQGCQRMLLAGLFTLALTGGALAQTPAPAALAAATTPAVASAIPAADSDVAHNEMNFRTVFTCAGWLGELVWLSLIVCLIISAVLIVDSYLTIQEKKIAPQQLVSDVRDALEQGDLLKALQHCENTPVPLSRILKAGFSNAEEGFEVVQDAVSVAADMEGEMLMQRVSYLSVISNTTPILGLIGTVIGTSFAFFSMGAGIAGAAPANLQLAVNLAHGLWATAFGLGAAVPAGIFYVFFKMRCARIILHQEALTLDLIKTLRNVEVVHD